MARDVGHDQSDAQSVSGLVELVGRFDVGPALDPEDACSLGGCAGEPWNGKAVFKFGREVVGRGFERAKAAGNDAAEGVMQQVRKLSSGDNLARSGGDGTGHWSEWLEETTRRVERGRVFEAVFKKIRADRGAGAEGEKEAEGGGEIFGFGRGEGGEDIRDEEGVVRF